MPNINLTQMSLEELKAFAYDCIMNIQTNQNNLKVINQEIEFRKEKPEEKK